MLTCVYGWVPQCCGMGRCCHPSRGGGSSLPRAAARVHPRLCLARRCVIRPKLPAVAVVCSRLAGANRLCSTGLSASNKLLLPAVLSFWNLARAVRRCVGSRVQLHCQRAPQHVPTPASACPETDASSPGSKHGHQARYEVVHVVEAVWYACLTP